MFSSKILPQTSATSDLELWLLSYIIPNMISLKVFFILYHLICKNKHEKPGQGLKFMSEEVDNRMINGLLHHKLGFKNIFLSMLKVDDEMTILSRNCRQGAHFCTSL